MGNHRLDVFGRNEFPPPLSHPVAGMEDGEEEEDGDDEEVGEPKAKLQKYNFMKELMNQ